MKRITFENITLSLTAPSAEEAYHLLALALQNLPLVDAEPAMSTDRYSETERHPLDPVTLREGLTTELY